MTRTVPTRLDRPQVIDDWFLAPVPCPAARVRLLCFPHAGGDATAFALLAHALAPSVEVWGVRLPRRGARLHDPMPADFGELVGTLAEALLPHTNPGVDFGMYGQSFGALLAFEVARALPPGHRPRFLVPASAHAPQQWAGDLPETLDAAGLLAATGFGEIAAQDPELMAMTLSVTGADLDMCRTYRYLPGELPVTRVHVVAGADDPLVRAADLPAWAEATGHPVETTIVAGGHVLAAPTGPGPAALLRALALPAGPQRPDAPRTSTAGTASPAAVLDLDLSDTAFWQRPDLAEAVGALRDASPVRRTMVADDGPVWSVFSYELAARVLGDADGFSSTGGSLLGSSPDGSAPAGSGRMMAMCDPPLHRNIRSPVAPFFNARSTTGYAPRLAELAEDAVRTGLEKGDVNFVDVIAPVPLSVMCDLLDIPAGDRGRVVALSDNAFLGTTAQSRRAGHQELIRYLFTHAVAHRARPASDLVSTLATHHVGGGPLPLEDVVLNLDNILVGGVQTVRHTAAMGILALLGHPDGFRRLWNGEVDMAGAVDELLRWTSSGLHVLRTATRDLTLGPATVRAGDKVVVWTWAANHDPAQFDRPGELRLDRTPNRHLGLGWGPHYCVGAALAKAELTAVFTALRRSVRTVALTGTPRHNRSIINFGLDELPVRLVAR